MERFDWNGLRRDTPVVVHTRTDLHLLEGRVVSVDRARGRNDIGVRLADGSVIWPTPGEVHLAPRRENSDRCWRCTYRRSEPVGSGATGAVPSGS